MIYQNTEFENTQNQFSNTIKELQIGKLLRRANITKNCGASAFEVFQFLLLLVFQGKNLFRFLNSKHKDQAFSKNTYYRFLNETSYHWKKFLLLLAVKVTTAFDKFTRLERVKVLVLDDSVIKRNRSKKVELLAKVYDHVEHKFQKGFTLLTLGWSDGYSFVPVGFNMLSSGKKSNRYQEMSTDIDCRSNGYKARKESLMAKTDAAILLIERALNAGIRADYVLIDTWFTTEPMIRSILTMGLDVIPNNLGNLLPNNLGKPCVSGFPLQIKIRLTILNLASNHSQLRYQNLIAFQFIITKILLYIGLFF